MKKAVIVIGYEFHNEQQTALIESILNSNADIELHKLTLDNIEELPALASNLNRPVLIAIGKSGVIAWSIAGKLKQLGAMILIHPQELPDFLHHQLNQTCLLIHSSTKTLTSAVTLKTLQRPRPDIAQLVNDEPTKLVNLITGFIKQFSGSNYEDLGRVIRWENIAKEFPAPAPGAVPVFEDDNCFIGAVQLDNHTPYEHINYRDEIHVVISGSGHFRHGAGEMVQVKQGDIAYVKAFEKHRWSDWSADFKLLFIQCGQNPLVI